MKIDKLEIIYQIVEDCKILKSFLYSRKDKNTCVYMESGGCIINVKKKKKHYLVSTDRTKLIVNNLSMVPMVLRIITDSYKLNTTNLKRKNDRPIR